MTVVVITPPADPIVTWEEADAHLKLDGDLDQQAYVEGLIAAATAWLDGPGGWLGRALGRQALEWRGDCFPAGYLALPFPPLASITSVKYVDVDGAEQTVDPDVYAVQANGVRLAYGARWPTPRGEAEAVRIRYDAGYDAVPTPITQATLLLVGQWYASREAVTEKSATEMPFAVEALLAPYRVWSL